MAMYAHRAPDMPFKAETDGGDGQPPLDDYGQALPRGHYLERPRWTKGQCMTGLCLRCGNEVHGRTWYQCRRPCFICGRDDHFGQHCPEQKDKCWYKHHERKGTARRDCDTQTPGRPSGRQDPIQRREGNPAAPSAPADVFARLEEVEDVVESMKGRLKALSLRNKQLAEDVRKSHRAADSNNFRFRQCILYLQQTQHDLRLQLQRSEERTMQQTERMQQQIQHLLPPPYDAAAEERRAEEIRRLEREEDEYILSLLAE
ncbi:hypothetical protein IWZ01DRAFT_560911 [Phyllosticta capitalensis]